MFNNLKQKKAIVLFVSMIGMSVMGSFNAATAADEATPKAVDDKAARVTDLLKHRLRGIEVTDATETPVKDVYQTSFDDRFGYLLDGGRFVLIGELIDLETGQNITAIARRANTQKHLASFDNNDMIIYPAKGETKTTLTVFTDTSCGYCRKLHEEANHLIDAGIQIQYIPFPRGSKGGPGYQTLRNVWCSADREMAMHVGKGTVDGEINDPSNGSCAQGDVVDKGFIVGNAIGVTGTPALFTAEGKKIDGYVPYDRLIPMLLGSAH